MTNTQTYTVNGTKYVLDVPTRVEFECTVDGANKFWDAVLGLENSISRVNRWTVIIRWGKIGTVGQTVVRHFPFKTQAEQYLQGRIRDKQNKGYVAVTGGAPTTVAVPAAVTYVETAWDLL